MITLLTKKSPVLTLIFIGIFCFVPNVDAYFYDTEVSDEMIIGVGTLDLTLEVLSSTATSRTLEISNNSTLPFNYTAHVTENSDPLLSFCDEVNVTLDGSETDLLSFMTTPALLVVGDAENLSLEFSVDDAHVDLDGKVCAVEFVFEASQEGFNHGEAFYNTDTYSVTLYGEDFGTPPPSEPTTPDVVINEVMWMGSVDDDKNLYGNDEWIELRNMTGSEIDISQWSIENAKSSNGTLNIPANATIPANGFYLIARNPTQATSTLLADSVSVDHPQGDSVSLANNYRNNGALVLKDAGGSEIDKTPTADTSDWPKGENVTGSAPRRWSMERNDDPSSGWHTCDRSVMDGSDLSTMQGYWNADGQDYNCGTPGAANLSLNDPSSQPQLMTADEGNTEETSPDESRDDPVEEEPMKSSGDEGDDESDKEDPKKDEDNAEGGNKDKEGDISEEGAEEEEIKDEEKPEEIEADDEKDGDGKVEDKTTKEDAKDSEDEEDETDTEEADEEEELTEGSEEGGGDSVDDSTNDDNTDDSGDSGGEDGADDNSEGAE